MPIVDTLIEARWIIPIEPHNTVLEDHAIAIKDGQIVGLFPQKQLQQTSFTTDHHWQFPDHVLMPGLVNAHSHSPMSLMRGIADDVPLMEWLEQSIWPTEKKIPEQIHGI